MIEEKNKGRKITYEERVKVIKYCIENENNYAKAAKKYNVSYQQVYSWMKKYLEKGIESLKDKRGCVKDETLLEKIENLKIENQLLKARNRAQEIEIDFLKKIQTIERG
jgi:transposase-like protein